MEKKGSESCGRKVILILESRKCLLVESGILGFGIRNRAHGNRIPFSAARDPDSSTWNPESTAWNPESKTVLDSLT